MELLTYLNLLLPMLLFFIVLTIASKLIFSYGKLKVSHEQGTEETKIDNATTLNLNNFICDECKRTFTDPRPLSKIPIKPTGAKTFCSKCYKTKTGDVENNQEIEYLKRTNEAMKQLLEDQNKNNLDITNNISSIIRDQLNKSNIQMSGKTMWERKVELKRSGLSNKEIKELQKLENEIKHTKARGYTL